MDWNKLLSDLLQAVLVIALPALVGAGVSWLKLKWQSYKDDKSNEFVYVLADAVEMAVRAAEQSKLSGYIENKKDYALTIAEKYLEQHGLTVDLDVVDAAIEAEVQKRFSKQLPPAQG